MPINPFAAQGGLPPQPKPLFMQKVPQSDTLANALMQSAYAEAPKSPFDALGKLAMLYSGKRQQDRYLEGQEAKERAPYDALREALAGGGDIEEALLASEDPSLFTLGLKQKLDPPKPDYPSEVEEYNFAVSQGYPGSFVDFQTEIKKAGAQNITVGGGKYGTIPPGYELVEGPEGTSMRPIPGSPAATEAQATIDQEAVRQGTKETASSIVVEDIDRAIGLIEDATIPATGVVGWIASAAPGTNAFNVARLLDTVKANAGFDKLQAMRDASPTGGALGQVSEFENLLLQATIGNLEQSQSKDQLIYNLRRVQQIYDAIINKGIKLGEGLGSSVTMEGGPAPDLKSKYGLE